MRFTQLNTLNNQSIRLSDIVYVALTTFECYTTPNECYPIIDHMAVGLCVIVK